MSKGYIINELRLTGESVENASVSFKKGLNIISGPSDTGKSYILSCINYMLGSSKRPKDLKESKGYDLIFLEIKTIEGKIYTLKSDLKLGDFEIYESSIDNINNPDIKVTKLKRKHEAGNENQISFFLLKICNLNNKKLLQKSDGTTHELTYRNIRNITLINETEITKEGSPILSGQYTEITKEESFLKFLLTGLDDFSIKKNAGETTISNRKGKLMVLDSIIKKVGKLDEYENEKDFKSIIKKFKDQLKYINEDIEDISNKFDNLSKGLNELTSEKIDLLNKITILDNNQKDFKLNISRSEMLSKHYDSDIERLSATIESGYILSNNNHEKECPLCSNKVKQICKESDIKDIINSCISERNKIFYLKKELLESNKILLEKLNNINIEINEKNIHLKEVNNKIEKNYHSKLSDIRVELKYKYEKKNEITNKIRLANELESLLSQKRNIEEFLDKNQPIKINHNFINSTQANDFNHLIENLLKGINFPKLKKQDNKISLSLENLDLTINGEDRSIPGKGYRAITYSIFIIGLITHAKKHNINIESIILDSPILSYKEADIININEQEYENIGLNFYNFLSSYKGLEQIIILENKEPQESILNNINHIHFTGNIKGRYGFFPLK